MLIHDIFGQDNADLSITFEGYYLPLLENYLSEEKYDEIVLQLNNIVIQKKGISRAISVIYTAMPFISLILFIGLFLLLGISGEFSNFNVIIFVFYLFIYSVIVKSVFEWYLGFHHGKILDSGIIYAQQLSTQYESVGLQFHFTRGILWSLQFHVPDDSVANLLSLDTGLQEYPLLPAYEAKPPSYRSSTASLDSQNELGDSLNRTTSANSNPNSNDIESYVIGPRSDNVEISVPPPAITTESIQTRQANAMESRSLNLQSPTSPTINNLKDTLSLNLPSPNFTGLAETMSIDLPQPYPRTSSNFNMTVPSSSQVGASSSTTVSNSSSTTVSNSAASNANIETTNEVISHSVEDYHTVRIEINTIKIDFNTERPTEESIEIPQQQDDDHVDRND